MDVVAETTIQAVEESSEAEKAKQLPEPSGYHILIGIPESEEKTDGGILKARQTIEIEETATIVGFVLKLGPDCYQDKKRFPSGPWCKEGDFILMRSYSGTRISIHGKEFRIINDDTVEAVVEDPRGIRRV
jgi:co-chaperonin GroES (HSP10)|tara:strand:+ start:1762 stop:2154 length:393 start_codon:yes stop_codon:yes gene_type:complete